MKPPPFGYLRPTSIEEVLDYLREFGDESKVLAGGQSLVPLLNFRLARPGVLIDLGGIADLVGYQLDGDVLRVGSMTTYSSLQRAPEARERLPLLTEAIGHIGHIQIRNRGTVGGSFAHADPGAELPAVGLALDATIELASARGYRTVSVHDYFTGPFTTVTAPDEIVTAVSFPTAGVTGSVFLEEARRHGDFALGGVAVVRAGEFRVGALGVGSTPMRLRGAEAALNRNGGLDEATIAAAVEATRDEVDPLGDIHGSEDYRRHLVGVLLERAVRRLM